MAFDLILDSGSLLDGSGTPATGGGTTTLDFTADDPARRLRRPLEVALISPTRAAYRGQPVRVRGRLLHGKKGVGGLAATIYLSRDARMGFRVGTLVSDGQGWFGGDLPVPRDVPVGIYRVYAECAGNELYLPASSR